MGVALCGGFLVVFNGAGDIFFNAIAAFIQEAELILRFGVAAVGGAHEIRDPFGPCCSAGFVVKRVRRVYTRRHS